MKMHKLLIFCWMAIMSFSAMAQGGPTGRGSLVIVGGALASSNADVIGRFIALAGGPDSARVGIVPAASGRPEKYARLFIEDLERHGLPRGRVVVLPIAVADDPGTPGNDEAAWRDNADRAELAEQARACTGIWFLGGDQTRTTAALLDGQGRPRAVLEAIAEVYREGGVLGGTSAGAAIMSQVMIAGGDSFGALSLGVVDEYEGTGSQEEGGLYLTQGFGFFPHGIIDQHFDRKARLGRLVVACLAHQADFPLGFGIDENTALVYRAEPDELEVLGAGSVTVVDARRARLEAPAPATSARGLRVSVLGAGDRYSFARGLLIPQAGKSPTRGQEFGAVSSPLATGVMSNNGSLRHLLTYNLVDNAASDSARSYLFDATGLGFELNFHKDVETLGYWGYTDGLLDNYTAWQVLLDIRPVRVGVEGR